MRIPELQRTCHVRDNCHLALHILYDEYYVIVILFLQDIRGYPAL